MVDKNTKQKILEAGTQAVVAKSFNGCGLKEILDAAGVPKGSFYHYFKSKEDFGIALIEASVAGWMDCVRPILTDRNKPPMARVNGYFEFAKEHLEATGSQRQCLIAKIALEESRLSEPLRAAVKAGYDQFQILLAQTLREAQAAGEIDAEIDIDDLAAFLQNAWEGAMIRMEIDRNVEPLTQFIRFALDGLLTNKTPLIPQNAD